MDSRDKLVVNTLFALSSAENYRFLPELFGRPSPSSRTSLKSADSDFENTLDSDSDSACLFVYAFIL
jgi:hypothetical protein